MVQKVAPKPRKRLVKRRGQTLTKKAESAPLAKRSKSAKDDEEITSESDASDVELKKKSQNKAPALEIEETPQEAKIRMTQQYINQLEDIAKEQGEDEDFVTKAIRDDVLESQGKLFKPCAESFSGSHVVKVFRKHKSSPTAAVISPCGEYCFSSAKDITIFKWKLKSGETVARYSLKKHKANKGPTSAILSLAITSDGKFLASGERSGTVHIWHADNLIVDKTYTGHKGAVTGLVFRHDSHQLFSCSKDKLVKVWDIDQGGYTESLFGHSAEVTSIDCLAKERCVTGGGIDRSVRIWKLASDSQLWFQSNLGGSIDSVSYIDDNLFVSTSNENRMMLWNCGKKKPIQIVPVSSETTTSTQDQWVAATAAVRNSDLIATGGGDTKLRFWKIVDLGGSNCGLRPHHTLDLAEHIGGGIINSIVFEEGGTGAVVTVGREHRLGRWFNDKRCKNSVIYVKLAAKEEQS